MEPHIPRRRKRLVVGLMSGTSADSVDAVLAEISGHGPSVRIRQRAFVSLLYPKGYREHLLARSLPGRGSVDELSQLNILIAHLFADAVRAVARAARVPLSSVDLIGSHGQTVHHIPHARRLFGRSVRSTFQLGDISTLAALTGVPVVGNFRTADMAFGGQGAPLVPYFDHRMFRSRTRNRLLLNLGGIANATLLPRNGSLSDLRAFDTGPANMVIDALMQRLYGRPYDRGGAVAERGSVDAALLRFMLAHPYLRRTPPKSTGREEFGDGFVRTVVSRAKGLPPATVIATAAEYTALTVWQQYARHLAPRLKGAPLHELIVSGGGAKNRAVMGTLRRCFAPAVVLTADELGVSGDAKEALCFALLANETLHGVPANVPSVTGASRPAVLGQIAVSSRVIRG